MRSTIMFTAVHVQCVHVDFVNLVALNIQFFSVSEIFFHKMAFSNNIISIFYLLIFVSIL